MARLTYLGHSAFLLEKDGHVVAVDPFLSYNPKASHAAEDIHPETILVTHAHNDHVGDTMEIAKRTGAKVITTFELGEWMEKQGVSTVVPANHGGTIPFAGGTAKLVPAWHTSSFVHNGENVAIGFPAGFVVRMGDTCVYFAGDTCLFGDMRLIGEEALDAAVIPIGDFYTMGPADALRAVDLLQPKVVIPCHYNTFPPIEQDAADFAKKVESTGRTCAPLAPGESVEI